MKILFAGSPAIAVPALEAVARGHEVVGVLTNPESSRGRGMKLSGTEVARAAASLLPRPAPVLAFERLDAAARTAVAALEPDILVSFAYGRIFGPKFLALFPAGGLNVHPSLLPRHRGSTPIPQAILSRDTETGICVQKLALEMDSGDIFGMERLGLTGRETTASLSELCASKAADLLCRVLDDIGSGRARPEPQIGQPSYCGKITKSDGLLDWSLPAPELDARIRAYNPWPLAHCFLRGTRINIFESLPLPPLPAEPALPKHIPGTIIALDASKGIIVATGEGRLALRVLQIAGKKALAHRDFANGVRNLAGGILGPDAPASQG